MGTCDGHRLWHWKCSRITKLIISKFLGTCNFSNMFDLGVFSFSTWNKITSKRREMDVKWTSCFFVDTSDVRRAHACADITCLNAAPAAWPALPHEETAPLQLPREQVNRLNVNSLWPGDAIWLQRSRSTLAQVIVCCLTATSHYLPQSWLIGKVQLHPASGNFTRNTSAINHYD